MLTTYAILGEQRVQPEAESQKRFPQTPTPTFAHLQLVIMHSLSLSRPADANKGFRLDDHSTHKKAGRTMRLPGGDKLVLTLWEEKRAH